MHKTDHEVLNSTSQQVLSPEAWFTVVLFSQTHRFGGLCLLGANTTPEGGICSVRIDVSYPCTTLKVTLIVKRPTPTK